MSVYDAVLLLSGGKDSCSLAFMLKEQGVNFLALTVDQGFLSDIAYSNIYKVCEILDIDHIFAHPRKSLYQSLVGPLVAEGMEKACTRCSGITTEIGRNTAQSMGVTKLYAGFTKYTAAAAGWEPALTKPLAGGVFLINPYYESYDLSKIRLLMEMNGLEMDPIKTNCVLLPELLRNTNRLGLPNHLKQEVELLHEAGKITDKELKKYRKFVCQI